MGKNADRNRRQAERRANDAQRAIQKYNAKKRILPEGHRRGKGGRTIGNGG